LGTTGVTLKMRAEVVQRGAVIPQLSTSWQSRVKLCKFKVTWTDRTSELLLLDAVFLKCGGGRWTERLNAET